MERQSEQPYGKGNDKHGSLFNKDQSNDEQWNDFQKIIKELR